MIAQPYPSLPLDAARKAALAFFVLLMLAYVLLFPTPWQEQFEFQYSEMVLLALLIMMLIFAWLRAFNRNVRLFFGLIGTAFGCWALIDIISIIVPDQAQENIQLEQDVIFLLFFACIAAAIELRLDTRKDDRWLLRRVSAAVGSVLLVFAVFGYFSIIPVFVADQPYVSLLELHAVLDGYIGMRLLIASLQADERPWKLIYGLLGMAFVLLTSADLLSLMYRHEYLVYMPGSWLNVVWFLWYPFAFLATGVIPEGAEKSLDQVESTDANPNTNALLFFGMTMPLIHAIGYAAGWLMPEARQLRDLFIATWLVTIGVVLFALYRFVHQRLDRQEKRRIDAEQKADRFEEQLNRELRIRSLGRLSSGLAHDFGNTMTALEMHATAAEKRTQIGQQAPAEFEGVRKSIQYAKKMVNQLKLFGAADERVETEVLALDVEVGHALELIRPSLKLGVDVEFRSSENVIPVKAKSAMVHQVVTNYIHNAIDAIGEEGLIEVNTALSAASTRCHSCGDFISGEFAVLKVSDSGPGVSRAVAAIVYEPLVTTKPTGLGSGLGLSSVHGIMHKLGGHVGLTMSALGGACFIAYFPLHRLPDA
ncbi:MAG: hypothetical protein HKN77_09255 [Woeseiaceae bacterium]|nr:hypothetical protein [Woeseiaceae bacterium]